MARSNYRSLSSNATDCEPVYFCKSRIRGAKNAFVCFCFFFLFFLPSFSYFYLFSYNRWKKPVCGNFTDKWNETDMTRMYEEMVIVLFTYILTFYICTILYMWLFFNSLFLLQIYIYYEDYLCLINFTKHSQYRMWVVE